MKKTIIEDANIGQIKTDRIFERTWGNTTTANFFVEAVKKFSHYTHPVVYKKGDFYYLLGHKSSLDALIEQGMEEITVEVVDLSESQITEFLIVFLSREHKEPKCTVELMRVMLEYITTPDGRVWYNSICKDGAKEKRISIVLGISRTCAKYYLKVIQPKYAVILEKFLSQEDYSLNRAYNDCVTMDEQDEKNSGQCRNNGQSSPVSTSKTVENSLPKIDSAMSEIEDDFFSDFDVTTEDDTIAPQVETDVPGVTAEDTFPDAVDTDPQPDPDIFMKQLDEYKRVQAPELETNTPANAFASKVIVVLQDDSHLELPGEIELSADGSTVNTTEQLFKLPNGNWSLHKRPKRIALTICSREAA